MKQLLRRFSGVVTVEISKEMPDHKTLRPRRFL